MTRTATDEQLIEQLRIMGFVRAANRMQELLKAVAEERNACADLLEYGLMDDEGHHIQYAAAIRARGTA